MSRIMPRLRVASGWLNLRHPPSLTSYIQGDNSSVHPILISYLERGGLHPCDMNKSNKWGSCRNHLDIFELPAIRKSRENRRWYMKITIEAKIQCPRISLPEGMQWTPGPKKVPRELFAHYYRERLGEVGVVVAFLHQVHQYSHKEIYI